jgi:hypothetical protein
VSYPIACPDVLCYFLTVKKDSDKIKKPRTWPRKVISLLILALFAFAATDWYFNDWKTCRRLLYWNRLELKERNNIAWHLNSRIDFRMIGIPNVRTITNPDSLIVFDRPLRDSGYYRIYFRFSDTASAQLKKMYQTLSSFDTTGSLSRSVKDVLKTYQRIQVLFGVPPQSPDDTIIIPPRDTMKQSSAQINLALNQDDEATAVLKKLLGSPQVIAGIGIGMAFSAGIDLLRGDAYCAYAKTDAFRTDSLQLGAYAGKWEGLPIDILWAMKKVEVQQADTSTRKDTTLVK